MTSTALVPSPGLACTYFFTFCFGRTPKSGFWHETDRQKCYGRKNTGKFGVSANRIQWTTSRTKIRPKSSKKKLKLYFAYPSNPGFRDPIWALRPLYEFLHTCGVILEPMGHRYVKFRTGAPCGAKFRNRFLN